jgi:hypothetical protein
MNDPKSAKMLPELKAEAARLKSVWNSRPHRTQAEFGDAYGLGNQSNVGHYLNGRSRLNFTAAAAFAKELGCQIADFSPRLAAQLARISPVEIASLHTSAIPEHAMHGASAPSTQAQGMEAATRPHAEELSIPQYETGSRISQGNLVLEGKQPGMIKSWRVDLEWLRMNVRQYTSVQNLCIVTGFGPSMRPRFNPGDPLLMDKGITSMEVDGVYFFRVGDSGYIKQLQRIPSERGTIYRAKSYNPDYEPFDITAKMDFQVFGKILTIWKSEQV